MKWRVQYRVRKNLDLTSDTATVACAKLWTSVKVLGQLLKLRKQGRLERLRRARDEYVRRERDKEQDRYHESHALSYTAKPNWTAQRDLRLKESGEENSVSGHSTDSLDSHTHSLKAAETMSKELGKHQNLLFESPVIVRTLNVVFLPFWLISLLVNSQFKPKSNSGTGFKVSFVAAYVAVCSLFFAVAVGLQTPAAAVIGSWFSLVTLLVNSAANCLPLMSLCANKGLFEHFGRTQQFLLFADETDAVVAVSSLSLVTIVDLAASLTNCVDSVPGSNLLIALCILLGVKVFKPILMSLAGYRYPARVFPLYAATFAGVLGARLAAILLAL